jgi:hypothetical protein
MPRRLNDVAGTVPRQSLCAQTGRQQGAVGPQVAFGLIARAAVSASIASICVAWFTNPERTGLSGQFQ